jgi:hypothetical protein
VTRLWPPARLVTAYDGALEATAPLLIGLVFLIVVASIARAWLRWDERRQMRKLLRKRGRW